ncbi:MAG: glucosaminidase domain-containing protein, partial [Candidatus Cloacimonetes bacterium]|nr:glucosaminidase domain-containing protein [Candidatus Cloacimonadota bacterium]
MAEFNKIEPWWSLAGKSAAASGVKQELIYAQWAHETADFTSALMPYHNLAGVKAYQESDPGAGAYQSYPSDEAFAEYFGRLLPKYDGLAAATTPDQYASILKNENYFGASLDDYITGMKRVLNDTSANTGTSGSTGSGTTGLNYSKGINGATPILKFAKFAQSLAFQKSLTEGFEQGMEGTLHNFLTQFMQKFYHNLFYVPTLPDNKAIIVKPETLFVNVPSCNVIYPTLKSSVSFRKDPKSEPTRLIMISNHVSNLFGTAKDKLSQLVTMVFLDEKKSVDKTTGKVSYKQEVVGIGAQQNKNRPMNNLTEYEKRNGIRIMRESKGDDLYLFMLANKDPSSKTPNTKDKYVLSNDKEQAAGIGTTLEKLAAYTLLRARYETRPGNIHMYFNPYIVPGFPILNVEGSEKTSLNVYAYATDVTHSITESSWSTSVGFTATHIEDEPRPPNFPIAEDEYAETLPATYKSMLGDCVRAIDNTTGAATCRAEYVSSDKSVSSMLKKI